MRYINIALINHCKPANWDEKAAEWHRQLAGARNKSEEIKRIGNKWKGFKTGFIRHFGDKCWYSEVSRVMTDFDVDHFRPKGAIRGADGSTIKKVVGGVVREHPGYWWLAFESKNYRYSCIFSNRPRDKGGKHDYFPLVDETQRVWNQCDFSGHKVEGVKLLDPCSLKDVALLSHDKIPGTVQSRFEKENHPTFYSRVRESCKRYNLNHKTIKNARSRVIRDVKEALAFLENYWALPRESRAQFTQYKACIEQKLVDSCNRKSEFSAAAVAFVRPHKEELWLANVLPRLDLTD